MDFSSSDHHVRKAGGTVYDEFLTLLHLIVRRSSGIRPAAEDSELPGSAF
jgi:hypothetical protein